MLDIEKKNSLILFENRLINIEKNIFLQNQIEAKDGAVILFDYSGNIKKYEELPTMIFMRNNHFENNKILGFGA